MNNTSLLLYWWIAMMFVMVGLWAYQLKHKDGGIADVGWAYGLGGAAIYFAISASGDESRRFLLAILAGIWGIRLGTYLLIDRIVKAKAEDGRYQAMRKAFGENAPTRFFIFFQGQALFIAIFAIPFLAVAMNSQEGLNTWDFIAVGIWVFSNGFVWIADKQLANFRMDPVNKGEVCQVGLWRYSRHPNYFFEWLHWWSYVFLAIGSQYFWVSLIGPVVMLILLLKVTGIPYTELQALRSRGEKYKAYQNTTSPFFPWFPKESV